MSKISKCNQYKNPLCILYGSATGNSEHIAKDLTARIRQNISILDPVFDGVICCELDQYKKNGCLQLWETPLNDDVVVVGGPCSPYQYRGLLIVCSTTGNGDAPENASRFVRHMKKAATLAVAHTKSMTNTNTTTHTETTTTTTSDAPTSVFLFRNVCYAVLGLGDTNYDQYCAAAASMDRAIHQLGGIRCTVGGKAALTCADEGCGQLEDVVEPWVATIVQDILNGCRRDENHCAAAMELQTTPIHTDVDDNATASGSSNNITKDHTTTELSLGVQMVQSILTQRQQQQQHQASDESCINDMTIDSSKLPTLLSNTIPQKLFTLVQNDIIDETKEFNSPAEKEQQRRLRGLSITSATSATGGVGDDSVSSVSAGYYYTLQNPYHSHIVQARYLTQTPTLAASQILTKVNEMNVEDPLTLNGWTSSFYKDAERIYDTSFPLTESATFDIATVERNRKRVIELTLSLPDDSTLEYAPGDSLGLVIDNPISVVEYVVKLLQKNDPTITNPYEQKIVLDTDGAGHHRSTTPITIVTAVTRHVDVCSVIKNKRILYAISLLATDPVEGQYLRLLSSKTTLGETLFQSIIDEQRMNIVDVFEMFPSTQSGITLETLFTIAPNSIPPRYYSVSSSPLQHPNGHGNCLTVAFSVVDYVTPSFLLTLDNGQVQDIGQRRIRGTATRYMELLSSSGLATTSHRSIETLGMTNGNKQHELTPSLRIFPKPTIDFRMPRSLSKPLILIGPGTGIAPFMGFLRHRQALIHQQSSNGEYSTAVAAKTVVEGTWRGGYELQDNELGISQQDESGLNVGADYRLKTVPHNEYGSVDVFFGCRHEDHDWLYKEEMNGFVETGIISKLYTAFSRDGTTKTPFKYVQDIMLNDIECGNRLVNLICHEDAAVYVCGDGNAMAQDVQTAVIQLLRTHHFNDEDSQAKVYLEEMKQKQRFIMDIWS